MKRKIQIDIVTIFPKMFDNVFDYGILSKANNSEIIKINIHDLRKWTSDKHKQVDDRPYGGGPGMILMPEPLFKAIEEINNDNNSYVILTTPQGKTFNQQIAENLSNKSHLIIICGRYEGIDQRVIDNLVDEEISIGDYVLSGGEYPAMVITDTVARLVPDVIKNDSFNENESFSDPSDRTKLDFPQYTRPEDYKGHKVPRILLTGDHKKINEWRQNNIKHKI